MAKRVSLHKLETIYNKTQGQCAYCGKQISPFSGWQIEHMVPKARGGGNIIDNLVAACPRCNQLKKTKTPDEYKEKMTYGYAKEIEEIAHNLDRFSEYNKNLSSIVDSLYEISRTLREAKISFYMDIIDKDGEQA